MSSDIKTCFSRNYQHRLPSQNSSIQRAPRRFNYYETHSASARLFEWTASIYRSSARNLLLTRNRGDSQLDSRRALVKLMEKIQPVPQLSWYSKRRVKATRKKTVFSRRMFHSAQRYSRVQGKRQEKWKGQRGEEKDGLRMFQKRFFTVQRFTICVVLLLRCGLCMLSKVLYRVCASSSCIIKIYLFLLIT